MFNNSFWSILPNITIYQLVFFNLNCIYLSNFVSTLTSFLFSLILICFSNLLKVSNPWCSSPFFFYFILSSRKILRKWSVPRKTDYSYRDQSLQESKSKHLLLLSYLKLRNHQFQGFAELKYIYWPLWRMNYFKIKSLLLTLKTSQAPRYYITINLANIPYLHQFRYLQFKYLPLT